MSKWDNKAKDYSRYTQGEERFEAKVLSTLKGLHVDFKNKKVIDIGCGTGVYTLRIAKDALSVDGLDSSKEMLKILNEDAKTLNIKNITTHFTTWDEYQLPKKQYDIAICTMSPALSSDDDFDKMSKTAKIRVYLGWAGKRNSEILEELFKAHGSTYTPPNGAKTLKKWLNSKQYFYQVIPFDEEKISIRQFSEAVKNFEWHLEVRGIKPSHMIIKNVLEKYCDKDGNIKEVTLNHMNLILW